MTNKNHAAMTLADFERLLDVYGGDRTRWPAEDRAAAAQLVARDGRARRLLAEAEGLDRVLERAPLPPLAVEAALADRIVAAARRSPRIVRIAPEPAAAAAGTEASPRRRRQAPSGRRSGFFGSRATAAGFLVASLAGGMLLGLSSVTQSVVPGLADALGIDRHGYSLAQLEPFDEDVL